MINFTTSKLKVIFTFSLIFIALLGQSQTVYIGTYWGTELSTVDITNNNAIGNITTGEATFGLTLSHDHTTLYVANANSGTLSIIDRNTDTVVETVQVGGRPGTCALNSDGSKLYVSNMELNKVTVFDTENFEVLSEIETGQWALWTLLSLDGNYLYVANALSQDITVIDVNTDMVITTINVGDEIYGMELSMDGQTIYYTTFNGDLKFLNTSDNTITNTIDFGTQQLLELAMTPDGSSLCISGKATFYVFDIASNTYEVLDLSDEDYYPRGITISEDGTKAYVVDEINDVLYIVDLENKTILNTLSVAGSPVTLLIGKKLDPVATSTNNIDAKFVDINIYPNPVQDNMIFSFENIPSKALSYSIFDALGKQVKIGNISDNAESTQVNCSHLPAGFYTVLIEGKEWNFNRNTFVKTK